MKTFVILSSLFLALGLSVARSAPNVVLVMTDDQGYGDLRCHGNAIIKTPHLDRLHAESVRLTDFHVDPTCSPTRAALMTGRYSTRTGVWHTVMGRSSLYADEVTMGELFSKAGYRTGIFGKWHLGDNYPNRPEDRGFQEALIHGGGGVGQTPDHWGNDYFDDSYRHNGRWEKVEGYCTKVFVDHAIGFIEKNRSRPFFCYLPTNVPHGPNNVAEHYSRPYENQGVPASMARFYGMITEFDENLGRLRAALDRLGLSENTIFIFMTDNGTAGGVYRAGRKGGPEPGWKGFNAGMRGTKGTAWDGGHRVPFFVRWPQGGIGGGFDVNRLTAHFDVLPTLAELCGLPLPEGRDLDGRSFVPLLRGLGSDWPERTLFAHVQREEIPPKWIRSAALTERWRLIDGKELYDIRADPGQERDVAAVNPQIVGKLRADYEKWWSGLEPSIERHAWIVLGSGNENPATLTCMDWHVANTAGIPWDQSHIRKVIDSNGYWMVEFERSGTYEFTLRQAPAEAGVPIQASVASVSVGNGEVSAEIPEGAMSVAVTMDVEAGRKRMMTRFADASTGRERGAYFVDVRRLK